MPKFGAESLKQLSTSHKDLQTLFNEVIKYFDCKVIEGFRDERAQQEAFKNGHSKLQWPDGKHNHSPSFAVDVAPYPVNFNNIPRFYWFAGYVLATAQQLKLQGRITHDIRWGGDWNRNTNIDDEKFKDLFHYEIVI
jgi:peptidoglycan L-alanyl-D-glutamate endopeptidase CwlK